jgi:hypothetical protein
MALFLKIKQRFILKSDNAYFKDKQRFVKRKRVRSLYNVPVVLYTGGEIAVYLSQTTKDKSDFIKISDSAKQCFVLRTDSALS